MGCILDMCEEIIEKRKAMSEAQNIFPKREPEYCPNCRYLKFYCKCVGLIAGNVQNNPLFTNHEQSEKMNDDVNLPAHYRQGSMEVFDMMVKLYGHEAMISHCEITAFKYRMRAGYKKDAMEDLKKGLWYENKRKELIDELNKAK